MNTEIDTGGPAFPTDNEQQTGPNTYHYEGITIRDYFAAKALTLLVGRNISDLDIAKYAYAIADAMLQERQRDEGSGK